MFSTAEHTTQSLMQSAFRVFCNQKATLLLDVCRKQDVKEGLFHPWACLFVTKPTQMVGALVFKRVRRTCPVYSDLVREALEPMQPAPKEYELFQGSN
mmetsp:Transcript_47954/g.112034  ORF Transcript_47954/g.112034 Transcript_47954/m.112034 type:complete len:98 (-) Transcript_47954:45-338(-)